MKRINIDKAAKKGLDKADKPTRSRILDGIEGLLQEPPQGDIKQLKGALRGLSRLRVGDWRIVYGMTIEEINIVAITPRGGAYKKGV